MKFYKNIFSIIIFLTAHTVIAESSYCYRNDLNLLKCEKSINLIPKEYLNKIFFKEEKNSVNSNFKSPNITSNTYHPKSTGSQAEISTPEPLNTPKPANHLIKINNPKIQIYVAKWCPHCRALEKFLKSEHLEYTSYDIENDKEGIEVFEQEGGGIPITKINGTTIIGFDEKKFKSLLEAQKPY